jgi:hypothetical protein
VVRFAGPTEASAFLHRRVYPDFARDDSVCWSDRCAQWGRARYNCFLRCFSFTRGHRRASLCHTHMLAGRYIVRYAKAPCAEESKQAAALPLRCGVGGGHQCTLLLKFIARGDASSLFVSAHDHCPNAYIEGYSGRPVEVQADCR